MQAHAEHLLPEAEATSDHPYWTIDVRPDDPLHIIGTTIDKYLIECFAGEGGFSMVYRAQHTIWNEPVAIKFFSALDDAPEPIRDALLEDFLREGKLMSRLSSLSSTVVQARDVGHCEVGGRSLAYMVLEWVEGESLEELMDREANVGMPPRSLRECLMFLQPVADALALAHDSDIAHRDLKPGNIMLLKDKSGMKVLDFGIAKVMEHDGLQEQLERTSHVHNSFSPAYGAPEQFTRQHGATGPWTDVFAMALIIIEMMQNEPVLLGSIQDIATTSCDEHFRPTPRAMGMDVSDEVEAVFQKALKVAVADRYRAMRDFWQALTAAALGEALPLSDAQPLNTEISSIRLRQDLQSAPDPEAVTVMAAEPTAEEAAASEQQAARVVTAHAQREANRRAPGSMTAAKRRWLIPLFGVASVCIGSLAALVLLKPARAPEPAARVASAPMAPAATQPAAASNPSAAARATQPSKPVQAAAAIAPTTARSDKPEADKPEAAAKPVSSPMQRKAPMRSPASKPAKRPTAAASAPPRAQALDPFNPDSFGPRK